MHHVYYDRFVDRIPSSWGFIVASLLLRVLEGVGSALLFTVSIALIARLYPSHVGALYVRKLCSEGGWWLLV